MNKLIIPLASILLLCYSCRNENSKNQYLNNISEIENGLLPNIIFEGEETETFNIHDRMKYYKVPGLSIAFIDNGDIVWAKAYGFTDFDSTMAVNEETLFQAASISKPLAAMAALSMVEEGNLTLDDDVNNYLVDWKVPENEFTVEEKVTLRRLVSHSAGLTVHGFGGYSYKDEIPGISQVLNGEEPANSGKVIADVVPGTIYRYSGGGYTVMQKMLIDISGKSFPEIMEERVISKLGLSNSTYKQPLPLELQSIAAKAHKSDGEMIEGNWHQYPEMAAAGLWTTPTDLAKYAIEVQKSLIGESNLVLSQRMTEEMLTPQIVSQGLGPSLGGEGDSITFGHGGSNAGYRCQLLTHSKMGQGVAIMTNSDNGGALMSEILRSFSNEYGWWFFKPKTKVLYPLSKEMLENQAGIFKFDQEELFVEFNIEGNHLKGLRMWDNLKFDIYPESETMFINKENGESFEFKLDDNGRAIEVIFQGTYRFVRTE